MSLPEKRESQTVGTPADCQVPVSATATGPLTSAQTRPDTAEGADILGLGGALLALERKDSGCVGPDSNKRRPSQLALHVFAPAVPSAQTTLPSHSPCLSAQIWKQQPRALHFRNTSFCAFLTVAPLSTCNEKRPALVPHLPYKMKS